MTYENKKMLVRTAVEAWCNDNFIAATFDTKPITLEEDYNFTCYESGYGWNMHYSITSGYLDGNYQHVIASIIGKLSKRMTEHRYKRMVENHRLILNSVYGHDKYSTNDVKNTLDLYNRISEPDIKDVIFNDPATIVSWTDGTKTVVKCQDDDVYDREKGLAMAIVKKKMGTKGSYYNIFTKYLTEDDKRKKKVIEKASKKYRLSLLAKL